VLLVAKGNGFEARKLDLGKTKVADLGTPGRCLVGDLDDDGLADVLQTGTARSLFFKGKAPGSFDLPAPCPVALGKSPSDAFLGDWDMDGRLDVFCTADDMCRLWHNYPGLKLQNRIYISGEIAYISKPGALSGNTCDVNNDGLQDVFLFYSEHPDTGPQIFFNRGFRSFGHGHKIDISENNLLDDEERKGQQYGIIADLTDDGAQDMAVALKNGDLYIFPNNVEYATPVCVRAVLPLGAKLAGPVKVTAWNDRQCLGAWNVVAGTSEGFFGQMEPGVELTLKWRVPGGPERKKVIQLEDKPVRLVLEM
jgi:hypothetical protein